MKPAVEYMICAEKHVLKIKYRVTPHPKKEPILLLQKIYGFFFLGDHSVFINGLKHVFGMEWKKKHSLPGKEKKCKVLSAEVDKEGLADNLLSYKTTPHY